jgi:hypothetical protein
MRGEIYDTRMPSCYATAALAEATAAAAKRRMMPVSQFIRVALLEAINRDGVALKETSLERRQP